MTDLFFSRYHNLVTPFASYKKTVPLNQLMIDDIESILSYFLLRNYVLLTYNFTTEI